MNGNYMNAGQAGAEQDYSHTNHYHSSRVAGIENGYASTNGNNYSPSNGYSGTNRVNGHAGQHNGQSNGTNGQSNGHHSMPNGHPMSNGYDDMDSNGVDSGQGSSLDRDYSSYNGHGQYSGTNTNRYGQLPPGGHGGGNGVWQGVGQQQQQHNSQYYYNLPHRQQQNQVPPPDHGDNGGNVANNNSPRRRAPGDTLDLTNREYRGSAFELYKKPGYSIPSTYSQDVPR